MCKYLIRENGNCNILNSQCPHVYFCSKQNRWRENKYFPKECKVAENKEIPTGSYRVCFERHGNLYVEINNHIKIFPNPFKEDIPKYVKAYKMKNGNWRIKK